MKWLITGGAGFVGSHFIERLLKDGHSVTTYDNLTSGKMDNIKQFMNNPNFKFIKADILDLDKLKLSMKDGYDIVFHLSSNPDISKSMSQTDLDLKQGIIATYNVLESMRISNVKKIVYFSGSGIYGNIGEIAPDESFGPLIPISMYGASKLACEGLVCAFCHMFEMQAWILRPANIVGKNQTHGVTLDFIKKLRKNPKELEILGDGKQSKSYLYVEDIIDAVLICLDKSKESVNIFNVAAEDYLDVISIAKIVCEEMNLKNVKFKYTGGSGGWKGDVPIVRFNINKIKKLGWKPRYKSEEAVRLAVRGMLDEKSNIL